MKRLLVLAAILSVLTATSVAAERTWTSADGKSTIEADMVDFKDGKVLLQKSESEEVVVPLAILSEVDRQYVKTRAASSGAKARMWTSSDGKFSTKAVLVSTKAEKVLLRKSGPQVIAVPLENLSTADRQYVKTNASAAVTAASTRKVTPSKRAIGDTSPQTCTLEMKRLEPLGASRSLPATNYLYRMSQPQSFYMRPGSSVTSSMATVFSQVIKKEPAEYVSERPFRGVANLGGQKYGFVLDAAPSDADPPAAESDADAPAAESDATDATSASASPASAAPKAAGYSRLYFDINHNGDLTDDGVIEAKTQNLRNRMPASYLQFEFPRTDLTLDIDGKKVDYAFFFNGYSRSGSSGYAYLRAAAYCEGQIRLEGKTRHLVLIDFNSNGRFDDELKVLQSGSRVIPVSGDKLLVDPQANRPGVRLVPNNTTGIDVSQLVSIDGGYYNLEVSPAGDELTLTPSSSAIGYVNSGQEGLSAMVYGDQGVLKIAGGNSEPIPLPAGQWKLATYTISHNASRSASSGTGAIRVPSSYSTVSARAGKDSPPIEVRAGETADLPFGPPYKPIVTGPSSLRAGQTASLSLSLVGTGGEVCTGLVVNGKPPEAPEFTIKSPDGEEVDVGKFKYG